MYEPWIPVQSSRCHSVRYDPEAKQLEIQFHKGKHTIYTYDGCKPHVFQSLLQAGSKGKWIDIHIVKAGWNYSAKR